MLLDANDKKSLTELNYIINNMSEGLYNKIPKEIINYIEENMDSEYILDIDITKKISKQEFLPQTKAWFSLIISEYVDDEKGRKKWKKFDEEYIKYMNIENKFDSELFFNKGKLKNKESKEIVEYKSSFLKELFLKFFRIFKRKRRC